MIDTAFLYLYHDRSSHSLFCIQLNSSVFMRSLPESDLSTARKQTDPTCSSGQPHRRRSHTQTPRPRTLEAPRATAGRSRGCLARHWPTTAPRRARRAPRQSVTDRRCVRAQFGRHARQTARRRWRWRWARPVTPLHCKL